MCKKISKKYTSSEICECFCGLSKISHETWMVCATNLMSHEGGKPQ